jgi:predicted RNA binding protein YcfA (HicA-like mRNA interferase family)
MKLPRDVSADQPIKALRELGYSIDHQRGSHIRIVTQLNGQHHETIPNHSPIKVGTLAHILQNIARHHNVTVEDLLLKLDL